MSKPKTTTVVYRGPFHGGVGVDDEDVTYACERGKAVELPTELADRLLAEQPDSFTTVPARASEKD